MSNRRRASTSRTAARTAARTGTDRAASGRSRPFGGRARGGPRSYAMLTRMHAMPRWTVPLATVVLVFVGLYAGPVLGGLCLLAIAAFLGWLAYLAWPTLPAGGRALRLAVLLPLAAIALARLLGMWG